MRAAYDKLTTASHKLAEEMYRKTSEQSGPTEGGATGGQKPAEEGVVDADFEEVK
jgi:molecular chaperone DnaK